MNLTPLIVASSVLQIIMFVLLALGSIYESKWMTFSALIALMVSLFINKTILEP